MHHMREMFLHVENLHKNVEVLHCNPGLGWQRGFDKVNLVAQRE